jgi:hypothetical protein
MEKMDKEDAEDELKELLEAPSYMTESGYVLTPIHVPK